MKPVQEEDVVPERRVLRLTVAAVVMTVGGTLLAWGLGSERAHAFGSAFTHVGPAERPSARLRNLRVGVFDARSVRAGIPAAARLDQYGWVDRGEGVVHIPIEKAIDLEVAREGAP